MFADICTQIFLHTHARILAPARSVLFEAVFPHLMLERLSFDPEGLRGTADISAFGRIFLLSERGQREYDAREGSGDGENIGERK